MFFFFNDTATTEIYTLSLHDALPICLPLRVLDKYRTPLDLEGGILLGVQAVVSKMRSPHAPRLQVHGHDSWIAGPDKGTVHVQVRYKDGPPDLVYGEILVEGARPPGVRWDRDEAVQLVVSGVPGHQLGRKP